MAQKTSQMAKAPAGVPKAMNLPATFRKKGRTAGRGKKPFGGKKAPPFGGGY